MVICYNCKQENLERAVKISCGDDPDCPWGLIICEPCLTRMGDGTQHAVIESRAHSATHKPFMVVRLHPDSDTKGLNIGDVKEESELKALIKHDYDTNGPADYLVHEKTSKKVVRVNLRGVNDAKAKTESPMEKAYGDADIGKPKPDGESGPSAT